jgi:hypothetical protein
MGTKGGAYTSVEAARRAYSAIPFSEFHANREHRKEMAEGVVEYWQDFNSRLPRLSPAELAWLTTELDTTDVARLNRASQTREFHFWELANLADQCMPAAINLLAAFDTPDHNETEMFHWTKVAICYHQSDA